MHVIGSLALLLLTCLPAAAATTLDARFDLSLRGVTGGQIAIRAEETGGTYAVTARASATGLVGRLVRYGYEGQAEGRVGRTHRPTRYSEVEMDDGERTVATTRFQGNRPIDVTFDPPRTARDHDIDPTAQSGVIDPLSALYLIMRPTLPTGACGQRHSLFDGRHVSRLSLGPARTDADGTIRCDGEYRRLRGYAPEKMAERPVVPLQFAYAPTGAGLVEIVEIRSPTRLGDAVLRRR
ncbi:DUF3108 domain-containing protein [Jannaschia sp. S6380]|uniref:DUF3108 domain-containing protein n=1 Tax=Jannaschia sp. S6380 TaxID=2926408 RepID=UPI001FF377AD|nr:DUF3108 domain-containing protein [Jannaschia sp. S6380]MCK0167925.1 DUF3108 domain-containing protein [Jannaschia sp. S6380]